MAKSSAADASANGGESDSDILEECRKNLKACIDDEEGERRKMEDDLAFCTLDQWPADVRKERENDIENGARPCLTLDKINPFVDQVVNDVQQGRPGITVRPQDDVSDPQTAKILKGLVRNIEDQSSADIAYGTAVRSTARIGLGFIRVLPEYVSDDSFDQDLFIRPVANTFSVHLGRHSMPDGSDAQRGYVAESMPEEKFCSMFPKAKFKVDDFDGLGDDLAYWRSGDNIVVVEEYVIKSVPQTLYFLEDGTTITKSDYDKWPETAGPKPAKTDERQGFKRQLKWRKMTGIEVLDKRDLPGKYIPIVECIGKESWVEGRRIVWGLVRPAKDALRQDNYIASTIVEKMGLAPKTPYIGAKGQFEGVEEKWKKANRTNFAYLEYNAIDVYGNAIPRPERQGAMPIEAAMINYRAMLRDDVRESLGMFKASVGDTESQQSGRAILALQRESDTGTSHFGHNLGISIRHVGRILIDLIPHYYDTKRVIRILGDDGEVQTAQLDPDQETAHREIRGSDGAISHIYNPSIGQYDISITVGPSYNTKRMEAAATFVEMAKGSADPASAAVLRYLVMRNSDSAGADEAAKLLKTLLPPQALQALASNQPIPPQAQAQMAALMQKMQQMGQQMQEMQDENVQLKAGAVEGQAKVKADYDAKMEAILLDGKVEAEKARLAREKVDREIDLKERIARAEYGIKERAQLQEEEHQRKTLAFEQECRAKDEAAKAGEKNEAEAIAVAPNLIQGMQGIVAQFAEVVTVQQKGMAALIAQISKPKQVTAKSSTGTTMTATVQ